jgi:hypothetical protein
MPMPSSFHFRLGELGFHYDFTLVDDIGSAYWTLGEGMGPKTKRERVACGIEPLKRQCINPTTPTACTS